MRVAVLGAGGTIAPAIVRDLAESEEFERLDLLDLDGARARDVAERHAGGRATAAAVDAGDPQALMLALEGCGLLLNAASYRVNLLAMDACLAAGCAYLDLGGLYHLTGDQLARSAEFEERGLLALLGVGAGPGKTNLMAARAARELDRVQSVRCASAGLDTDPPDGLSTPYAPATLLDELTLSPVVVREGAAQEIAPMTDGGAIPFPEPIGTRDSLFTLHSEVRTLPGSLGASECDFRLSLAPRVLDALVELRERPREEVAALRPAPPSAKTFSAQHVEVAGERQGAPATVTVTALTVPHEGWGLGGGIVSTAGMAAAAARLYARGRIPTAGVLAPEACLSFDEVAAELQPRGCRFEITIQESEVTRT
jgi:lysine 6-dehydrogenase